MKLFVLTIFVIVTTSLWAQNDKQLIKQINQALEKENYSEVVKLSEKLLQTAEKEYEKTDDEYIEALKISALAYEKAGDTSQALNYYNEVYNAQLNKLSEKYPVLVTSLDYTRDFFHTIQFPDVALDVYKNSIERVSKIDTLDYSAIMDITSYYSEAISTKYGTINNNTNISSKSIEEIKKEKGEKSKEYLYALDSLANYNLNMARYNQAKELFLKSYKIRKNNNDIYSKEFINTCINLGFINYILFKYDTAQHYYEIGINSWEKSKIEKDSIYINALFYYGATKMLNKDYQGVIDTYKKAVDIIKNDLGNNHIMYSTMLSNIAISYKMLKDYKSSIDYYNKYYDLLVQQNDTNSSGLLGYYLGIGPLYEETGEYDKAQEMYIKANNATIRIIQDLLKYISLSSEKRIAQNFVWFTLNLNYFYSFCLSRIEEKPELSRFLYNNELIKKGLILRLIKEKISQILSSNDEELISYFNEWTEIRQMLSKLYLLPISERKENVLNLEVKCKELENKMASKLGYINYNKKIEKNTITWKDVRDNLKNNEAAIEFMHFDAYNFLKNSWVDSTVYGALIIKKDYENPRFVYLFCEKDFHTFLNNNKGRNSYDQVKKLYTRFKGSERDYYKGDSLYGFVWEKIEPYLTNVKTIYYSPSGLLHKIAFNAIADTNDIRLIKKYKLNQLSTTAILAQQKDSLMLDKKTRAVLYGGILYDSDPTTLYQNANEFKEENYDYFVRDVSFSSFNKSVRGTSWGFLKGTLYEVNEIDSILKSYGVITKKYTKENAVEESIKFVDTIPNIIHIATHGFFLDSDKPKVTDKLINFSDKTIAQFNNDDALMKSGLLFAGANTVWSGGQPSEGIEDGILTAYEVSKLNLTNTKLVVLSACETGLGEIKGSEGVYGLQRSFKIAGAEYIIMSLWQIPDKQTVELMKLFYKNWTNNMDVETAFYKAQQTMSEKYDPFYWAAFVLVH